MASYSQPTSPQPQAPAAPAASPQIAKDLAWALRNHAGARPAAAVDDGTKLTLPGSDKTFTLDQVRNRMGPADWFPGDHPAMPPIVAQGREAAGIWACGLCHYPNGKGRPENAGVAGLNKAYFVQRSTTSSTSRLSADREAEHGR